MSQCKHVITTNSTFSWWGAYLSDDSGYKFGPQPRYQRAFYDFFPSPQKECYINLYTKSGYPKRWLLLNPFNSEESDGVNLELLKLPKVHDVFGDQFRLNLNSRVLEFSDRLYDKKSKSIRRELL